MRMGSGTGSKINYISSTIVGSQLCSISRKNSGSSKRSMPWNYLEVKQTIKKEEFRDRVRGPVAAGVSPDSGSGTAGFPSQPCRSSPLHYTCS